MIFEFIWDSPKDRVKRHVMVGDFSTGGLRIRDVESHILCLRLSWLQRLNCHIAANWKAIPFYYFNKFGSNLLLFKMNNDDTKFIPNVEEIPLFYRLLLEAWFTIRGFKSKFSDTHEIKQEIIWGNKNITYNGKALFFENWMQSGFIYVNDIIGENGMIDEKFIYENLKDKRNWMAELMLLKKSFPKEWLEKIKMHNINVNVDTIDL